MCITCQATVRPHVPTAHPTLHRGCSLARRVAPAAPVGSLAGVLPEASAGPPRGSEFPERIRSEFAEPAALTRLTHGYSKKVENHACAVALHGMFCNFAKIHKTLRVTPAMQAGMTNRLWTLEKIARPADSPAQRAAVHLAADRAL